ncbi:hypothetical protein R3P38DRAFT_3042149 [Favolaschia claudopus]|uniref:FAD-binding domain-containing protein n=1 Tax=Favolaschia claudopus TaxID=2862362 RepID=A0AAW0A7U2_9AGAR
MHDLKVIVVGAGIGGRRRIRVPPNSVRLSRSWGVDFEAIPKETSLGNRFVDWHGNHLLDCPFDDVQDRYGAPYYFIHRADLIDALVSAVKRSPRIILRMGTPVASTAIKSAARPSITGSSISPIDTGDVAYRILVPTASLLASPDPHIPLPRHAVGYPLRNGTLYNIIIDVTHTTDLGAPLESDEWRSDADNACLVERFKDWCPAVRELCALTGRYLKWKLADFKELERWVEEREGRVALLGDACHPMMPYLAQGAAQATEDAAALAAALRMYDDIPTALKAYEAQRKPRSAYIAYNTRVLQNWLHLYDGEEQRRRDELMKHDNSENPIFWGFSERKDWLFGHDSANLKLSQPIPLPPSMPPTESSVYLN